MKSLVVIFALFCFSIVAQSQSESLIVIHYDEESKLDLTQHIYKYNFVNYAYIGREKIVSVKGRLNNKDYIRLDKGKSIIYKNRYLVSTSGKVIDLFEKKVLHDGTAKFVKCSNDSIIFFTNDLFKGKFYSVFDISTKVYTEVKSLTYNPIIKQDVEFDVSETPYKLFFYPKEKQKILILKDAGHGCSNLLNKQNDIPIYWIDQDNFIFPNVKISNIEGVIQKCNLKTNQIYDIGKFSSLASNDCNFNFTNSGEPAQLEFCFKDKIYKINLIQESMEQLEMKNLSNGFSASITFDSNGRRVFYNRKEVGILNFALSNAVTSANYFAAVKDIVVGGDYFQNGLSVYNIHQLKWEFIKADEIASLVGWINN